MSTSLSPDQLLGQAQEGHPERLGQLLENYRHYLHLLGSSGDRTEPSGEARRFGSRAGHAAGGAPQFLAIPGIKRNAVRLLAAADHGGKPCQPPAALPWNPRPGRSLGKTTGSSTRSVVPALGPWIDRPGQFAQSAGVPPRTSGPSGRCPRRTSRGLSRSHHSSTFAGIVVCRSRFSGWSGRSTVWRNSGCGGLPVCARPWGACNEPRPQSTSDNQDSALIRLRKRTIRSPRTRDC